MRDASNGPPWNDGWSDEAAGDRIGAMSNAAACVQLAMGTQPVRHGDRRHLG